MPQWNPARRLSSNIGPDCRRWGMRDWGGQSGSCRTRHLKIPRLWVMPDFALPSMTMTQRITSWLLLEFQTLVRTAEAKRRCRTLGRQEEKSLSRFTLLVFCSIDRQTLIHNSWKPGDCGMTLRQIVRLQRNHKATWHQVRESDILSLE